MLDITIIPLLHKIIHHINNAKTEIITRKELKQLCYTRKLVFEKETSGFFFSEASLDSYRLMLTNAGYLETTEKLGTYKIIKKIPEDLTVGKLNYLSYGYVNEKDEIRDYKDIENWLASIKD